MDELCTSTRSVCFHSVISPCPVFFTGSWLETYMGAEENKSASIFKKVP